MDVDAFGINSDGRGAAAGSAARALIITAAAIRAAAAAQRLKREPLPAAPLPALLQTMRIRAPPDQPQTAISTEYANTDL
jgi:hypothetical protein